MKEFIDKLISRLEELRCKYKNSCDACDIDSELQYDLGRYYGVFDAIAIVNELAEEYKGGWIPCKRELPKDYDYVYATCVSLIDDREPWVIEGYYSGLIGFDAMSSMLSYGEAKVVAWMPHKLPAPFAEGE